MRVNILEVDVPEVDILRLTDANFCKVVTVGNYQGPRPVVDKDMYKRPV